MTKYKIYALKEPNTNEIKYIGATTQSLEDRLKTHLHIAVSRAMEKWLKELKEKNEIPEIILLEEAEYLGNNEREVFYMNKYKDTILNSNFNLQNILQSHQYNQNKRPSFNKRNKTPKTTSGIEIKGSKNNLYIKIPKRIIKEMNIEKGETAMISVIDKDTMEIKIID